MSPSRMGGPAGAADTTLSLRQSIGAGLGLKEGFMRERVAQLEADLKMAQQREGLLEAEAMQVWRGAGVEGWRRQQQARSLAQSLAVDPAAPTGARRPAAGGGGGVTDPWSPTWVRRDEAV